jgi:hypothetical protein
MDAGYDCEEQSDNPGAGALEAELFLRSLSVVPAGTSDKRSRKSPVFFSEVGIGIAIDDLSI